MKRKLPVRTARIELDGEYQGFWLEMRTNPKLRVIRQLSSGDLEQIAGALAETILSWNLPDEEAQEEGALLPISAQGVEELPADLLGLIASRYNDEVGKLPPASSGR